MRASDIFTSEGGGVCGGCGGWFLGWRVRGYKIWFLLFGCGREDWVGVG
jgi:hypothetical protein